MPFRVTMIHPNLLLMPLVNCQKVIYNGLKNSKGAETMKENKLVEFIYSLTEEEIDKIIAELPKLIAMLEESAQPCLPERSAPIQ